MKVSQKGIRKKYSVPIVPALLSFGLVVFQTSFKCLDSPCTRFKKLQRVEWIGRGVLTELM